MKRAYLCAIVVLSAFVLPTATRGQFLQKPEPGVSPGDSAAAIQQFRTASGGGGQYFQFLDTYTIQKNKKDSVFKDTMSLAISDGHNTRVEFSVFGVRTEVLGHAGLPRFSLLLNSQSKTYRLHIIDTAAINRTGGMSYQVMKVGTETMQGYNCIHARMTMSTPGSKVAITEDIWTSNDVPGYAALKKMALIQNVTPAMMKALEQAGCDGFMVKVVMHSTAYSLDMVLVQAVRKDFPASLFELPAGYTPESNTNGLNRVFQK